MSAAQACAVVPSTEAGAPCFDHVGVQAPKAGHAALSTELLGEFLRKLDAIDSIQEQTRIAMLLVVLTACHKAEVIGGTWAEIDLDRAEW